MHVNCLVFKLEIIRSLAMGSIASTLAICMGRKMNNHIQENTEKENNKLKKQISNLPIAIVMVLMGIGILFFVIKITDVIKKYENNMPDDAQWYEAKVKSTELHRVSGDDERHRYSYKVTVEYTIDGENYENTVVVDSVDKNSVNEKSSIEVYVSPSQPDKIYKSTYSATGDTSGAKGLVFWMTVMFMAVGGIFICIGIFEIIKLLILLKKQKNQKTLIK